MGLVVVVLMFWGVWGGVFVVVVVVLFVSLFCFVFGFVLLLSFFFGSSCNIASVISTLGMWCCMKRSYPATYLTSSPLSACGAGWKDPSYRATNAEC